MDKIYLTPGPSQLYPTVKDHITTALSESVLSISHRSAAFQDIYASTEKNLRQLLSIPDDYYLVFLSSATEAMERIIQSGVDKHSHHLVNGAFSKRFYSIAQELGKNPGKTVVDWGQGFDLAQVKPIEGVELIAITHNETSTGVALPLEQIYKLRSTFPDSLLAVDIVSSAPCVNLDFSQVDAAFFSVQKGFGLPAGLGVLAINQRCLDKAEKLRADGKSIGSYHSLPALLEKAARKQNPETPNVLGIYLLGEVCADMIDKGIDIIRRETVQKADLLYDTIEEHPDLRNFAADDVRSKTVVVAETKTDSAEYIQALSQKGFIIGSGYGKYKTIQIRVANFPSHAVDAVEQLADYLTDM